MQTNKKIIVCSPCSITGGPELLHQLVHELRTLGHDANIAYYPFEQVFNCPEPYRKYQAPQVEFNDAPGVIFIIPETATWICKKVHAGSAAVWWLSVDNYFFAKKQSCFFDAYWRLRSLWRTRVPLFRLRNYSHFVQSAYADEFLRRHHIIPKYLTDYLSAEHFGLADKYLIRNDIVVFNPKKGLRETTALIRAYPNINFVPIKDMNASQVRALLERAKIYIDFGNHPGKDRLPREAAVAGCCVISGMKGAAANPVDLPIPEAYKLDDSSEHFVKEFGMVARRIFSCFPQCSEEFEVYRHLIKNEPIVFRAQVKEIFGEGDAL